MKTHKELRQIAESHFRSAYSFVGSPGTPGPLVAQWVIDALIEARAEGFAAGRDAAARHVRDAYIHCVGCELQGHEAHGIELAAGIRALEPGA